MRENRRGEVCLKTGATLCHIDRLYRQYTEQNSIYRCDNLAIYFSAQYDLMILLLTTDSKLLTLIIKVDLSILVAPSKKFLTLKLVVRY
jgi:hypothetical protein